MQINAQAGSSNKIFQHEQPKNPNRSRFDLSRITNLTADSGMIIPFDWFTTLPGDSFDLEAETAVESLPTVTNVLTPYKVKTHWYYVRMSDLWEGWETFITKGRTGNIEIEIPKVKTNVRKEFISRYSAVYYGTAHSLQSYLGIMPEYENSGDPIESGGSYKYVDNTKPWIIDTPYTTKTGYKMPTYVSALPFMAYQAIVKYNYVDQNLLQDNTALFPEKGDSDWRIPYNWDSQEEGYITNTDGTITTDNTGFEPDGIYKKTDTKVGLQCLRYAPFEEDEFISAMPWQQRGNVQTMKTNIDLKTLQFNSYATGLEGEVKYVDETSTTIGSKSLTDILNGEAEPISTKGGYNEGVWNIIEPNTQTTIKGAYIVPTISTTLRNTNPTVGIGITANNLRELIAMSVWQERNARVNGSYNSMIWIHWSENPNANEHYPIFIGGSSDYINFQQITQTSETQNTPQGTVNSIGQLYSNQKIGRFNCPDYGIIMGILIISPTTTYNTTIDHHLICENVMEDYAFPEFEQLGPQPILNGELYTSGNEGTDKGLFAYRERYSYLKTRPNVNRGLFRMPSNSDILFSSASQSREFDSTPDFSYQFVTQSPENTRRDWLAYESEPMFKVQVASKIDAVRPLSYQARPNTFGF